jgi:glycosyltransferase involved in cell wall biosynthesis
MGKKILFTVTNDLVYDQRMQRICGSMAKAGYEVILVGREKPDSPPLPSMPFRQVRLPMKNHSGKLFYAEYNLKLYRYLIKEPADALCAIDLDTIIPVYLVSKKRRIPRMYDAHEFFTEMIEVKSRWHIHFVWKRIEKWLVPKFSHGYTVGAAIAKEFKHMYGVHYGLVRNMPAYREPVEENTPEPAIISKVLKDFNLKTNSSLPIILYQGAINEGRALHKLVAAMAKVDARLLLVGSGNLEKEIKRFIAEKGLEDKIYMCGNVPPQDLRYLTSICFAGITIFDAFSKNQYYSLGNKFFDYMMAYKPQVCVHYPEYASILEQYPMALPLENTEPETIANSLNKLIEDPVLYWNLQKVCKQASKILNWDSEEQILLDCWKQLFANQK